MKKIKKNKLMYKILFVLISALIFLFVFYIYNEIYIPAKASTIAACYVNGTEIIKEKYGLDIVGSAYLIPEGTNISNINFSNLKISRNNLNINYSCIINTKDIKDREILRHELCHCKQDNKNLSCSNLQSIFNRELECYIKEKIPFLYENEINNLIK